MIRTEQHKVAQHRARAPSSCLPLARQMHRLSQLKQRARTRRGRHVVLCRVASYREHAIAAEGSTMTRSCSTMSRDNASGLEGRDWAKSPLGGLFWTHTGGYTGRKFTRLFTYGLHLRRDESGLVVILLPDCMFPCSKMDVQKCSQAVSYLLARCAFCCCWNRLIALA